MNYFTHPMRRKDKDEGFVSAYVVRPIVYLLFQVFSAEARFLRKYRSK